MSGFFFMALILVSKFLMDLRFYYPPAMSAAAIVVGLLALFIGCWIGFYFVGFLEEWENGNPEG